ncbi:Heme A synthase [Trichinella spiralis]|uniref:Heme A synthase n=1 Tax=Trichinella spiralis TaxID=6334 RepID=A0ABR3KS57_TRISP
MVKCEAGTELPSTPDRRKQWTIYLFVTTPKKNNGCYTGQRWLLFGFCIANEVSCKPIRAIFGMPMCVGHQTLTGYNFIVQTWMPQHYMAILALQVYCWIIDGKSSITKWV